MSVRHLDVVVVEAQIAAVTFKMRLGELPVEEGVIAQFGELDFVRSEIEGTLQHSKRFLLIQKPCGQKV